VLLVGVGGTVGALARFLVDVAVGGRRATLAVNVLGSVVLGAVAAAPAGDATSALVGVGFCGAFTTFSSFAVGVERLVADGDRPGAARYAAVTLAAAVVGVALGAGTVDLLT
jgi:CrcB protein